MNDFQFLALGGAREIGAGEVRAGEIRAPQRGPCQPAHAEVRAAEIGVGQVRAFQRGAEAAGEGETITRFEDGTRSTVGWSYGG